MNRILWQPKALRQLRKIKDEKSQEQIFQEAQTLKNFPDCANIKRLTNHIYDYRFVLATIESFLIFRVAKHVSIEEVKKQDEHTY